MFERSLPQDKRASRSQLSCTQRGFFFPSFSPCLLYPSTCERERDWRVYRTCHPDATDRLFPTALPFWLRSLSSLPFGRYLVTFFAQVTCNLLHLETCLTFHSMSPPASPFRRLACGPLYRLRQTMAYATGDMGRG